MSNARQERSRPMTAEEWNGRSFSEWAERCWARPIGYGDWWPDKIEITISSRGMHAVITESRPGVVDHRREGARLT